MPSMEPEAFTSEPCCASSRSGVPSSRATSSHVRAALPRYLQCARVLMDPALATRLGAELAGRLRPLLGEKRPGAVVAPALGGVARRPRGRPHPGLPRALHRAPGRGDDAAPGVHARGG